MPPVVLYRNITHGNDLNSEQFKLSGQCKFVDCVHNPISPNISTTVLVLAIKIIDRYRNCIKFVSNCVIKSSRTGYKAEGV